MLAPVRGSRLRCGGGLAGRRWRRLRGRCRRGRRSRRLRGRCVGQRRVLGMGPQTHAKHSGQYNDDSCSRRSPHLARGPRGQSRVLSRPPEVPPQPRRRRRRPAGRSGDRRPRGQSARHTRCRSHAGLRSLRQTQDQTGCLKRTRHFSAVSMPVENCEHTDNRHRNCDRNADRERDHGAEPQHRQCDPGFNIWDSDAHHSGDARRRHHCDEGRRAPATMCGRRAGLRIRRPPAWR